MKLTFLGGADEVGASGVLVEMGGRRVLVDCGIRPSPKARYGLSGDQLPDLSLLDQAGGVDALVLTHAHTDHSGALELVLERYPHIPVYATPATAALTRVLHQDARRIMQTRLEEEGELPLFDDVAVQRLMAAFTPLPFQERFPLGEGLALTFYPAGHIAGAAMAGLESDEGRVLVSGDVSFSPQRTVGGAKLPAFTPDVLVLESTYGGRLHANRLAQERRMLEVVQQVTAAGGKVLVPAFALGRAQELLLILAEAQRRGELAAAPVWADGMVRAVCQVYTAFAGDLPLAFQERGAAFFGGAIQAVQSGEQRNALLWQPGPAVIVSSSGMLAGGPALAYARALAGQPQHAILLTGYQDEESPGRRLQEMAERGRGALWLGKDKVDVQCRLGAYSLSAHADEGQLLSMVETLNPAQVVLVHGDEPARASLAAALQARRRSVHLPAAGQTLQFDFVAPLRSAVGLGSGRALDVGALWQAVSTPAGGYFHLDELAQAWWGGAAAAGCEALASALADDDLYFIADTRRPALYRARPPAQVEITQQRRARLAELGGLPGQWVRLRAAGGAARLALCTALARDYFWVEDETGESERAWPEDLLAILGAQRPAESDLLSPAGEPAARLEPNQALALANAHFPKAARLRRSGYRLDQHVLQLTFDFPDVARRRYAAEIAALEAASGWRVELASEANQGALFALAQEVLPPGVRIVKGPALHRQERRVAVTVAGASAVALEAAQRQFEDESGFALAVTLSAAQAPVAPPPVGAAAAGGQMEINAAYAFVRAALEGSTLYRTSLKGSEIVLSFISPQVGERYRAQIDELARQTGWALSVNPQANQGAILEVVQGLLGRAGLNLRKGPGVYLERGEVTVTLVEALDEDRRAQLEEEFEERTGFRLMVGAPPAAAAPARLPAPAGDVVMVPRGRIRLRRFQREMALDPVKVTKAVERIRRMGEINPPLQLRRVEDGYLLLDGLYRLRAAEELGLEQVPAIIA